MRICPSCGFENDEAATNCALCHRALPLAQEPAAQEPAAQEPVPQQPMAVPPPPPPPPAAATPPAEVIPPSPAYPPPPPMPAGMLPPQYPPPSPAPILQMPRPELTGGEKAGRYFLGIGLALLPAILAFGLVSLSSGLGNGAIGNVVGSVVPLLYLAAFVYMIYALTQERLRFIGYGMLTVLVVAPVVFVVACIAILSRSNV